MPSEIILVTGAASGIGAAVAQALVTQGSNVALFDSDVAGLELMYQKLSRMGPQVLAFPCDVTSSIEVGRSIAAISGRFRISGLVNVAGVLRRASVEAVDLETWRTVFAVNCEAVLLMTQAVAPEMRRGGGGSIVSVTSNAAAVPRVGLSAYCASKAAASQLMRCAALELASDNIRCNTVSPGSTDTPMLRQLWQSGSREETLRGSLEQFRVGIPLGRVAEPQDIAGAVLFLLSDAARQITMADIRIDGGATLGC